MGDRAGKPALSEAVGAAFSSPEALSKALDRTYLADAKTALTLWLGLSLSRPLLIEGPAGVGKTDLARAAAEVLSRKLVRLQCYEGLDEAKALYEWDYGKQLLFAQLLRDRNDQKVESTHFFTREFLIERPLLSAITSDDPVVLLIDEVDRGDPEFEAFLLELLAENQVTIPELGTFRAKHPPLVVLTTNGTRDMTDALRRRCLHLFLDYPPPSREIAILELRIPGIDKKLAEAIASFVTKVRGLALDKAPSIAETIDWARALILLGRGALDAKTADDTLGLLVKHEEDRRKVSAELTRLLA